MLLVAIIFAPIAIETLDSVYEQGRFFLSNLSQRLSKLIGDVRETVIVQHFNRVLFASSFIGNANDFNF